RGDQAEKVAARESRQADVLPLLLAHLGLELVGGGAQARLGRMQRLLGDFLGAHQGFLGDLDPLLRLFLDDLESLLSFGLRRDEARLRLTLDGGREAFGTALRSRGAGTGPRRRGRSSTPRRLLFWDGAPGALSSFGRHGFGG